MVGRGAELGWASFLVSEDDGGGSLSGKGVVDLAIVAEEMGRLVSPGPLVPTNVVADAVARGGSAALRDEVLPGIVAGEIVAAWCIAGPGGGWDEHGVAVGRCASPTPRWAPGARRRQHAGRVRRMFAGVPTMICPAPNHAVDLDLTELRAPSFKVSRPPSTSIAGFRARDCTVVTHQVPIGTFDGPHPFFGPDGKLL